MIKMLKLYTIVALYKILINLFRFLRCSRLKKIYNKNIHNRTPAKNYSIKHSSVRLFKRSGSHALISTPNNIVTSWNVEKFNAAYDNSIAKFKHNVKTSLLWPYDLVEQLVLFSHAKRIKHKLISFLVALLEAFLVYLLSLYLDTTGIGIKILNILLDFLRS